MMSQSGCLPRVSIPIGFSHQLRLEDISENLHEDVCVSIPIGFSHQLRQVTGLPTAAGVRFQSLSGFLIS